MCLGRRIPHYDRTVQCTAPCGKCNGEVSVRVRVRVKVRVKVRIVLGVRVRVCVDR